MKMSRLLFIVNLVIVGLLVFVSCAAPAPQDVASSSSDSGEAGGDASGDQVVLTFLAITDDAQLNAWKEILTEFQKIEDGKWSYVEIEFETVPFAELFPKIESSVAAGLPWDLFQADGPDMKHYGFNEVIIPLGEYFSEDEMKQWFPQSIEEGSYKGELLGPPIMQSCSLMMYNKDMTDAAGISPPDVLDEAWTMDEALEAWKATTIDPDGDGIADQWGVRWGQGTWTGDYEHGIFRRSNGELGTPTYQGMGEDGMTFVGYLDTEEAIEAMQFYQDMHQTHKVSPVEAIPEIFESGKSAFMITPDNRIGALNNIHGEGNFNWGVTGIPYFKTPVCHTGSWHYGISPNTTHFDEALAFVKFASSDEGARIWYKHVRQLPANVGLFNELPEYADDGNQRMWLDAMNSFGIPRIQTPGYTEYQQIFAESAINILQGADPTQQLQGAAKRIEGLVAKYSGWNE
ncbi:sugar ABC transporter substrate-binding protein [Chloroflexi bacterium TSY]|nr:sugar ABC transporter substrate-binding protein [Chloroflexi bacterium TSY]